MKSTAYTAFTRAIDDAIELLVRAHMTRNEAKIEQRDFLSRRFWWINEKLGSVDDDVLAFELEEILIETQTELGQLDRSIQAEMDSLDDAVESAISTLEQCRDRVEYN
jgi:hypothetical protein